MMGVKYLPTALLLLLLVLECECQIRCYQCSTETGIYAEKCGDNFRLTSTETSKCQGSCQKTRGYRDVGGRNVPEITRSCVQYQDRDDCRTGNHNGIDADICICNTDLCNSATVIYSSWSLQVSLLLAVILSVYWRL